MESDSEDEVSVASTSFNFHDGCEAGDMEFLRSALSLIPPHKYEVLFSEADMFGMTPLLIAISAAKIDVMELLLDNKADPNDAHWDGAKALHMAVSMGSIARHKAFSEKAVKVSIVRHKYCRTREFEYLHYR